MNKWRDIDVLIKWYAQVISEEKSEERAMVHRKLCDALNYPYDQFKPFEDKNVERRFAGRIPTYKEAVSCLNYEIRHFTPTTIDGKIEPFPHCGCCQVPINDNKDWAAHVKTKEHLENAILTYDKLLSDGHAKVYITNMIKKIDKGEVPEDSQWLLYYINKKECELLLKSSSVPASTGVL